MAVVEETVLSLDDAKELIKDLTNLGERHLAMSITEKHLKVRNLMYLKATLLLYEMAPVISSWIKLSRVTITMNESEKYLQVGLILDISEIFRRMQHKLTNYFWKVSGDLLERSSSKQILSG